MIQVLNIKLPLSIPTRFGPFIAGTRSLSTICCLLYPVQSHLQLYLYWNLHSICIERAYRTTR